MENYLKPKTKKLKKEDARGSITPNLKKQVWENYCGIHVVESCCALCGINKIYLNKNSAFECAHIVADKFLTKKLSVLYLYPSCSSCNNECGDLCLLDYLWVRGRFSQLRKMIMDIYKAFIALHDLSSSEKMAWKVLQHLYGQEAFPAGGGIVNERQIYEQARNVEYEMLIEKTEEKLKELRELQTEMRLLMECEIKPRVFI